jgi:hypothetical protein
MQRGVVNTYSPRTELQQIIWEVEKSPKPVEHYEPPNNRHERRRKAKLDRKARS